MESKVIRLRAATRGILEAAMRQFGVLRDDGAGGVRPAQGVTISWLGKFKIGVDAFDPVTGDVLVPADTDKRHHVDLLITGSALTATFQDYDSGEYANASALEVLLLIWGSNGVAVDTNIGAETALLHSGIELIENIATPRHAFAGVTG